jgi:hypothetical protein
MKQTVKRVRGEITPVAAYTCPGCGTSSRAPSLSCETVVETRRPLVPLWDGGPLVEDPGDPGRWHVTDQIFFTDACGCRFRRSEWDVRIYTYSSGAPTSLVITPRERP